MAPNQFRYLTPHRIRTGNGLFLLSTPTLFTYTGFSAMTMKKQINLLRGWPNPALLPTTAIQRAAQAALSDPAISTPGLLYGPDPGYQPLRESIASWLSRFYGSPGQDSETGTDAAERICITGGASQNLACMLQVFTDPLYTQAWMVAPCYFLACRIFDDSGLKTRSVGEGEEGVDLRALEEGLKAYERDENAAQVSSIQNLDLISGGGKESPGLFRIAVPFFPIFVIPLGE